MYVVVYRCHECDVTFAVEEAKDDGSPCCPICGEVAPVDCVDPQDVGKLTPVLPV